MIVKFKKLDDRAIIPRNAYGNDAGWDLFTLEDTIVHPGIPVDVRTGIAVAIPDGYYGRITHRSSAPRSRGIMVLEGTIDCGFRGELFTLAYSWLRGGDLFDLAPSFKIKAGQSIAQLIVQRVEPVQFEEVTQLPESLRGEKGYGSSGA